MSCCVCLYCDIIIIIQFYAQPRLNNVLRIVGGSCEVASSLKVFVLRRASGKEEERGESALDRQPRCPSDCDERHYRGRRESLLICSSSWPELAWLRPELVGAGSHTEVARAARAAATLTTLFRGSSNIIGVEPS